MKTVSLIYGGGGSEHSISKLSADYISESLKSLPFDLYIFEMNISGELINKKGEAFYFQPNSKIANTEQELKIDYAIPCFHGYPGETGDIQSILEMYDFKYLGCNSETSRMSFNKAITKLWLEQFGIKTVPFVTLSSFEDIQDCSEFINKYESLFVKAVNQGSSVGCFKVKDKSQLSQKVKEAFTLSSYVILEASLNPREIEVCTFSYKGELHITKPSEILSSGVFYDYDKKYSGDSHIQTKVEANLNHKQIKEIQHFSNIIHRVLKVKDLARIDFFIDNDELYFNEINTFPGLTKISMFPKMMTNYGVEFKDFINDRITYSLSMSEETK